MTPDVAALLEQAKTVHRGGDPVQADTFYRQILELDPNCSDALQLLGVALAQQRQHDEALRAISAAVELAPQRIDYRNNLGLIQWESGNRQGALRTFREALTLTDVPDDVAVDIHCNMGVILVKDGEFDGAIAAFQNALSIRPDHYAALCNLGQALRDTDRLDEAERVFQRATELVAESAGGDPGVAWSGLGLVLRDQARTDEAAEALQQAVGRGKQAGLRWGNRLRLATLLPLVADSVDDIAQWRERYSAHLQQLAESAEPGGMTDPLNESGCTSFLLAYHGLDNRELQALLSRVCRRMCPSLGYVAPHCRPHFAAQSRRSAKLRIGFVSRFFYSHSIGRVSRHLIAGLPRDRWEVHALFIPPRTDDTVARAIAGGADRALTLPSTLEQAREAIANLELDVLFYQDIGMEPMSYYLAHSRLAPLQCTYFGHPDTTGIDTIDAYLSAEYSEPDNGEEHYTEKLVRLPGLAIPSCFPKPELPGRLKTRAELGLPEQTRLYICPQVLFKLHPDFDMVLKGVLERDTGGEVVLVESRQPAVSAAVKSRLQRVLGDCAGRLRWLPYLLGTDYHAALAAADVMLDSIHFGGMNSTLDGFAVGTPVVTLPGAFQRGRQTAALYRRMNFTACIAHSVEHYVELSVDIARDRERRTAYAREIAVRSSLVFEDRATISIVSDVLLKLSGVDSPPLPASTWHSLGASSFGGGNMIVRYR